MDRVEPLHPVSESNWPRGLIIAVPAAQSRDHPAGPGQASSRVRVLLPLGLAFERRNQRFEGFDFRLRVDGRGRQLVLAIAFLHQLDIDTSRLYRGRGQLQQTIRGCELAVLQLQPLRMPLRRRGISSPGTVARSPSAPGTSQQSARPFRHPRHRAWLAAASVAVLLRQAGRPLALLPDAAARFARGYDRVHRVDGRFRPRRTASPPWRFEPPGPAGAPEA